MKKENLFYSVKNSFFLLQKLLYFHLSILYFALGDCTYVSDYPCTIVAVNCKDLEMFKLMFIVQELYFRFHFLL